MNRPKFQKQNYPRGFGKIEKLHQTIFFDEIKFSYLILKKLTHVKLSTSTHILIHSQFLVPTIRYNALY